MTRQDYINHLDALREGVLKLIEWHNKQFELRGNLNAPTVLEDDRSKKTQKMFDDLAVRLYEDAGVSEKVKQEKLMAGDLEQAEMSFTDEDIKREIEELKRKGGDK